MDDVWEKLAKDWEGHEIGLVAKVDCGDGNTEILCEDYDAISLPLLMYGDPDSPEFYHGEDLSYEALSAFAKEHISHPPCNVKNLQHCREDDRQALSDFLGKSREELEDIEKQVDARVSALETEFDAKIAEIQRQYAELIADFNEEIDNVRKETNYKWLQQVLLHMDQNDPSMGGDEL